MESGIVCTAGEGLWLQTALPRPWDGCRGLGRTRPFDMVPTDISSCLTASLVMKRCLPGKMLVPVGFLGELAYKERMAGHEFLIPSRG